MVQFHSLCLLVSTPFKFVTGVLSGSPWLTFGYLQFFDHLKISFVNKLHWILTKRDHDHQIGRHVCLPY